MNVVQFAPTYGQACGIGVFAANLQRALERNGVRVRTVSRADDLLPPADVVLVQHEWGLFPDDDVLRRAVRGVPLPVVFVAHTRGGVERFADIADAFITMAPGVVGPTERPVFVFPHPAWTPARLSERAALRATYGFAGEPYTLGSSGFLLYDRDFPAVLFRLLPHVAAHGWRVEIASSRWRERLPGIEEALDVLDRRYPGTFRYNIAMLDGTELNERLQACDLVWCWTRTRSAPYASGSLSDLYASGTRLVTTDKQQNWHVVRLPNVVLAPVDLDGFVERLVAEARTGRRTRHDPAPLSWLEAAKPLAAFLREVADARRAAR